MPLNVVSNHAANVAHRNLVKTDMEATGSLSKLSIGKRVVSARDDAASMAIGSRMNAEVQGLKQAVVNAGQANSMLQIADGAMSMISDILTRMKVLSIQASSENLGTTEREFLDVEFQALMAEIDRIADDTDFNGVQLLDGEIAITQSANLGTANGVAGVSAQGIDTNGTFTIAYDGTSSFTVSDGTNAYTGDAQRRAARHQRRLDPLDHAPADQHDRRAARSRPSLSTPRSTRPRRSPPRPSRSPAPASSAWRSSSAPAPRPTTA